jgi:polyketide biosynthesis enoyl-CoA hydratase PksI
MIMDQVIKLERLEPGISLIRIDDPDTRNRLGERTCRQLMAALGDVASDGETKALILAGRADAFCSGASLDVLRMVARGELAVRDLMLPAQLLEVPVPVIGALEGHAVGGGLALALCCDFSVAAEECRYGINFAALGFTPGMGVTALLPLFVGHAYAGEMILTAKFYKGRELIGRGLFNHVVPAARVFEVALDLARSVADKPRQVLELIKGSLALAKRQALLEGMAREHLMHAISFNQPGIESIIEENYLT